MLFEKITYFLWGAPMICLFLLVGSVLCVKSRFFHIRRLGAIIKSPFYREKTEKRGQMSSFQAACTAIGGSVGVANISGVATAIVTGGAGALFWMWAAAFFGMIIKTAEVTLASLYRVRRNGRTWGGPTYYIERFLGEEKGFSHWKIPAILFGFGILLSVFLNVQNYAVSEAVCSVFPIPMLVPSLFLAAATWFLARGGMSAIGKASAYIVPFMCVFYIGCVAVVLCIHADNIVPSLKKIVENAFSLRPFSGGIAGSCMAVSMKTGFARSVYSNEAGWGTSPMVHASAEVSHPVRQGILGAFEVFADTMLVCTATGLLVICTGLDECGLSGTALALAAIEADLGAFAKIAVALSVFLFGLSSAVGWYAYYLTVVNHAIKREKARERIMNALFLISPLSGVAVTAFVELSGKGSALLWTIADFSAIIPTAVNLCMLFLMRNKFRDAVKDFEKS